MAKSQQSPQLRFIILTIPEIQQLFTEWTRVTRRLGRADFYLVNAELWLARSNFSKCFRALRMLINVAADAKRDRAF